VGDPPVSPADFQNEECSTRTQYPMKFREGGGEIADMAQGIAHADEINTGICERQRLGLSPD